MAWIEKYHNDHLVWTNLLHLQQSWWYFPVLSTHLLANGKQGGNQNCRWTVFHWSSFLGPKLSAVSIMLLDPERRELSCAISVSFSSKCCTSKTKRLHQIKSFASPVVISKPRFPFAEDLEGREKCSKPKSCCEVQSWASRSVCLMSLSRHFRNPWEQHLPANQVIFLASEKWLPKVCSTGVEIKDHLKDWKPRPWLCLSIPPGSPSA